MDPREILTYFHSVFENSNMIEYHPNTNDNVVLLNGEVVSRVIFSKGWMEYSLYSGKCVDTYHTEQLIPTTVYQKVQ